jgi:hypothetical protein
MAGDAVASAAGESAGPAGKAAGPVGEAAGLAGEAVGGGEGAPLVFVASSRSASGVGVMASWTRWAALRVAWAARVAWARRAAATS